MLVNLGETMADFFFAIGRDEVTWRLSPAQASDRGSPLIGPVPSGTSQVEFFARNGAGCDFINGGRCDGNPTRRQIFSHPAHLERRQQLPSLEGTDRQSNRSRPGARRCLSVSASANLWPNGALLNTGEIKRAREGSRRNRERSG